MARPTRVCYPPVMRCAWLLWLAASAWAGRDPWAWRETTTPHFAIKHQEARLPPGLTIGLERLHSRLRMDLGMFSPWMAKERIALYVYRDLASYVGGEFSPPAWSNGIAIYRRKAVAVPATREPGQLLRVLAHETTHLLFVGYFQEQRREPPHWLNEGLAMVEEAESADRPESSQWYQLMAEARPGSWLPIGRFLEVAPARDLHDDSKEVAGWYVQAYSVVHFLLRRHTRLQFKSFCGQLRDGKTAEQALWLVYKYRSVEEFERKWRAWAADPAHKRKVAALASSARASGDGVIEASRGNSTFQPFGRR